MSAFWGPWPKENELGQGAYQVGSEQVVLWGRGGCMAEGWGTVNALDTWRRKRVNEHP